MGLCGSNTSVLPISNDTELQPSHGGSVMYGGRGAAAKEARRASEASPSIMGQADDGEMGPDAEIGKGGSVIFAAPPPREENWIPGDPITYPPPLESSQKLEVALDENQSMTCSYGYMSLQGRNARPPHKPNQDSLVVKAELGGKKDRAMFVVFDGHGPVGEAASNYCRLHLAEVLTTHEAWETNMSDALMGAFPELHEAYCCAPSRSSASPLFSGSTAVGIFLEGDTLTCANVGDSRAILVSKDSSRASSAMPALMEMNGEKDGSAIFSEAVSHVTCRPLSDDHKPDREDERQRLEANPLCEVHKEGALLGTGRGEKLYVCRRDERTGRVQYAVLFSRSIGDDDAHRHLGISSEPELRRAILEPGRDILAVLATDGVWDVVTNEEAAAMAVETVDPQAAAERIVKRAQKRWDRQNSRRDDISIVIVRFHWEHLEKAAAKARDEMKERSDEEEEEEEDEKEDE